MAFAHSSRQDRRVGLAQAGPDKQRREAMKIHNQGVRFSLACVLLILGVAWGSPAHAVKPSGGPPGQADGGPPGQAGGAPASAMDTTASSTTTTSGTSTATSGVTYSGRAFGASVQVPALRVDNVFYDPGALPQDDTPQSA